MNAKFMSSSASSSLRGRSAEELQMRKRDLEYALQGWAVEGLEFPKEAQEEFASLDRFQIDLNASERPAEPSAALLISSLAQEPMSPPQKKKRGSFVPCGPTHLNAQLQSSQPELGLEAELASRSAK
ncbi:MAG: hypothetical protein GY822_08230 [Deltaproteobacteria bacterium]|nr:hypothetical protein [Deltaproteobacteria bacterium]